MYPISIRGYSYFYYIGIKLPMVVDAIKLMVHMMIRRSTKSQHSKNIFPRMRILGMDKSEPVSVQGSESYV